MYSRPPRAFDENLCVLDIKSSRREEGPRERTGGFCEVSSAMVIERNRIAVSATLFSLDQFVLPIGRNSSCLKEGEIRARNSTVFLRPLIALSL